MPLTANAQPAVLDVPALLQKAKTAFADACGHTIYLDYNGEQHTFRARINAVQRLFFFEKGFQKTALQNEYGVTIGQLTSNSPQAGRVRIDNTRYRYSSDGETLSLLHETGEKTVASYAIAEGFYGTSLNATHKENLLQCLVFAFAWAQSHMA